jgi:protein-S-isoprenylcysteine O-methyltransferase Ste14
VNAPSRRVLPPIWMVIALLASYVLDRWLPIVEIVPWPWILAGVPLIVLGIAMSASSAGAFRRAGTPVIPFETSTTLVLRGWYRVTRNPMYLGLALALAGVGVLQGSLGALLPLPVFIAILHFRFILGEERFLEGIFGEEYRAYKSRVRRWF